MSAARGRDRASTIKLWLVVVLGAFLLFNANFREMGLADTVPATLLPASVLREGNLDLDEFRTLLAESSVDGMATLEQQVDWTQAIGEYDGHLRSAYPLGAPLLALPIYAVPAALGWFDDDFENYRLAGKLSASLLVALSAGFLFLALGRVCPARPALLLTLLYAFGTSVCTMASQALWQHGPGLFCLSAALWLVLRSADRESVRGALLLSVALGMSVLCRLQNVVPAFAIGAYALFLRPRHAAALLVPAAALCSWQLCYNSAVFHDLRGGYPRIYQSEALRAHGVTADNVFTLPLHQGLAGLLFAPSRGLFVYSPALALPFFALPVLAARQRRSIAPFLLLWVAGTLLLFSKNRLWWGGTGYGPRYLLEIMPALVFALGMLWPALGPRLKLALAVLAVFGVLVQAVGLLNWECGWHYFPKWLEFAPERLWDWRDPEILRCTRALIRVGPQEPTFGPWVSDE
ncbi:MAG TPA: glycosyltransferase family 39 protein [Polyangiaceae bacterium]|nr:glycosyltransferase family 39 protein [Polyangiaceae bacterium]